MRTNPFNSHVHASLFSSVSHGPHIGIFLPICARSRDRPSLTTHTHVNSFPLIITPAALDQPAPFCSANPGPPRGKKKNPAPPSDSTAIEPHGSDGAFTFRSLFSGSVSSSAVPPASTSQYNTALGMRTFFQLRTDVVRHIRHTRSDTPVSIDQNVSQLIPLHAEIHQ